MGVGFGEVVFDGSVASTDNLSVAPEENAIDSEIDGEGYTEGTLSALSSVHGSDSAGALSDASDIPVTGLLDHLAPPVEVTGETGEPLIAAAFRETFDLRVARPQRKDRSVRVVLTSSPTSGMAFLNLFDPSTTASSLEAAKVLKLTSETRVKEIGTHKVRLTTNKKYVTFVAHGRTERDQFIDSIAKAIEAADTSWVADEIVKNGVGSGEVVFDASVASTDNLSVASEEIAIDSDVNDEEAVLVEAPDPAKRGEDNTGDTLSALSSVHGSDSAGALSGAGDIPVTGLPDHLAPPVEVTGGTGEPLIAAAFRETFQVRLVRTFRRDKNFGIEVTPASTVGGASLRFFGASTSAGSSMKADKVVKLTSDTLATAVGENRVRVTNNQESFTFIAREQMLRDHYMDAITRVIEASNMASIAHDSGDTLPVCPLDGDGCIIDNEDDVFKSETPCSFKGTGDEARGATLKPHDEPLLVGQSLGSEGVQGPSTLALTSAGDLLLSPGCLPNPRKPPFWAYRARAPGLRCTVEMLSRKLLGLDAIPISLTVKNGRWRVGRGVMCTLSRSPRVEGGWRALVPYHAGGREIRERFLVTEGRRFVLRSEKVVTWDSSES